MARTVVTPAMAQKLLDQNEGNRKLSDNLVKKYAAEMSAGRWKYNGDSIRISKNGTLLDGQHRLRACVRAAVSFETELTEDLDDDVRATIDAGRPRRASDVLQMRGAPNAVTYAGSIRLIIQYLRGITVRSIGQLPVSSTIIEDFYYSQPDLLQQVVLSRSVSKLVAPSPLAAVLFLGTREPGFERRAAMFVEPLANGTDLSEGDPRLTLRNSIINARLRTPGGRAPPAVWTFVVMATCWNYWCVGGRVTHIKTETRLASKSAVPDITGGPKFGAGMDALRAVRAPAKRRDEAPGMKV